MTQPPSHDESAPHPDHMCTVCDPPCYFTRAQELADHINEWHPDEAFTVAIRGLERERWQRHRRKDDPPWVGS